ncbi:hypothetical protein [Saccharothrix australiensis]|uniref:Uncharacterized protein n=1 Tax=Saccharothrix australiensis TaxID=2072 RepID=A0A495VZB9_9PSEU|nr:hypothetical protein [Saccharothrix australiensis]RKT54791.1 hypothetical protein C8E97_3440 [Saccharothrix australiensis]
MRNICRLIAAGTLTAPILLGAASLAYAAETEFDHEAAAAGQHGSIAHEVHSGADGDGNAYFSEEWAIATDQGAAASDTSSSANADDDWDDDWDNGWDDDNGDDWDDDNGDDNGDADYNGGHDGWDWDDDPSASFEQEIAFAGPDGAFASDTESHAEG